MTHSDSKPKHLPRESSLGWLRIVGPVVLIALLAFGITWHFVQPAVPRHVVIAAGPKTGAYYATAEKYVGYFKDNGVTLDVRETGGTVDNYKLLADEQSDVDLAMVQGGASPPAEQRKGIEAVAAIYFEPVLVFYRGNQVTQLSQLAGKQIAIGVPGSGVRPLAQMLLSEAGVTEAGGAKLLDLDGDAAADALAAGKIDAAFYVIAPNAKVVARLMAAPGVALMSFDHASAYGRLHPFLSATTLYRGSIDIARDVPAHDVSLIAAPTTLVARESTHKAIIQLLVRAAQETHRGATLLSDPGTFPNATDSDLEFDSNARYFLANPPNILHRTLPFWLASLIDRLIILLLPFLVVLIPLFKVTPALIQWREQRKLLTRYKRVRQIEEQLSADSPKADLEAGRAELQEMAQDLAKLKMPVAYSKDLFDLRTSVDFVNGRIEGWLAPAKN